MAKKKLVFYEEKPRAEMTILCIDQSYAECGIAVFMKGEPIYIDRLNFDQLRQSESKRLEKKVILRKKHKRKILSHVVKDIVAKYSVDYVIVERVRTFSAGAISTNAIIALGELISVIIDAISDDIPVLSEDTRSWKYKILEHDQIKGKTATITWAKGYLQQYQAFQNKRLTDNEADALGMGVAFYRNVNVKQEE